MAKRVEHRRRLSRSLSEMKPHYEVVVVGSGYGGSISASRLARAGRSVCLLERGREIVPGEYPDNEIQSAKETQLDRDCDHKGSRTALFDFRQNDDINVIVGCGLGGTSLINANVSLPAEDAVFDDSVWPPELQGTAGAASLKPYYDIARDMLRPREYPEGTPGYPVLKKVEANRKSGAAMGEPVNLTPINVNFDQFPDDRNHVGVEQQPCVNCGDCCSGCNYGSKNTVLMNYLPDAYNHGAEIFTQAAVRYVRKQPETGRWIIFFQPVEMGRERFGSPPMFVTADMVVLAAGSLGSTEILLRSAEKGLPASSQLGTRFTGNGDVLGFAYNCDQPINGVGMGEGEPDPDDPPGPCITSVIDARNKPELDDGMVIEEGVIPGSIDDLLPAAFKAGDVALGDDTDGGLLDELKEKMRGISGFFAGLVGEGAYVGAVRNTQTLLVMGHDGSDGRMRLEDDRLRIDWPGVGDREAIKTINQRLRDAAEALGGTYIRNPMWADLFNSGRDLITPHPLGGCCMGADAESGVVDHRGEVFSGSSGTDTHAGLYVADGSILPRSLGVNPLLTISALAERNVELAAQERGWAFNCDENRPGQSPGVDHKPGFRFSETMSGHITAETDAGDPDELDTYRNAEKRGKAVGTSLSFILTIDGNEVDEFIQDPEHESGLFGIVQCSLLSPEPLVATQGRFNLFAPDPDRVETREMRYSMQMTTVEGKTYFFEGFKRIHDDCGIDVWTDTTTLYTTVYDGPDRNAEVFARGIIHIGVSEFITQVKTVQIVHFRDDDECDEAGKKFGKFFAGSLFESFGKGLASEYLYDPDHPRERRPLRVDKPAVYSVETADGVKIRLARYKGGDKGPVMLSHGLGVSSLIFSIDTIETNLLEYLYEHGYDVWMLDYRVSIELNSSKEPYNADHVAELDYPAAIAKVQEVTGCDSVQMVAHCYGATTFTMAMLSGLTGVRSAVLSQISTDIRTGALTRIKSGLYIPDVLEKLGVDTMTAYVDKNRGWFDSLYDSALKMFYPIEREERARSAVHRRITFLYGTLYELDQLNDATFKALHEMFGVANIAALDHLATMVREKIVVNAAGEDVYVGNADRWNIPTCIIHGAENACFLPESTELTIQRLRNSNSDAEFTRHVIPGYGHIDCIYGRNASRDVFPYILEHLEKTA